MTTRAADRKATLEALRAARARLRAALLADLDASPINLARELRLVLGEIERLTTTRPRRPHR